jgi:hypothetical protein
MIEDESKNSLADFVDKEKFREATKKWILNAGKTISNNY